MLQNPMLTAFLAFEIPIPLVYFKTAKDASNSLLSYANDMIKVSVVSKPDKIRYR